MTIRACAAPTASTALRSPSCILAGCPPVFPRRDAHSDSAATTRCAEPPSLPFGLSELVCSQPWITELATGELLLVHRCASVLSSPPVVYNTYQDCREDHLVLSIGTADGSHWTRTQHVPVSSPTPARDILGGEFAVHTLSDGTVFLHAGCSYWRSRDHGRSFASNTTWNCTLCHPAVSSGSGQRCGGHGSAWGLVEVTTHGEAPPGLYFFGASSTP